jgi:hypothetical protein
MLFFDNQVRSKLEAVRKAHEEEELCKCTFMPVLNANRYFD